MSTAEITNDVTTEETVAIEEAASTPYVADPVATAPKGESYANRTSTKIAKMIVKKYAREGDRNFEIGAETWTFLLKLRTEFDKFVPSDYERTLANIMNDVRAQVSIDLKSIRLADWVSAHVLKSLVAEEIGELADKLDYYEYRDLSGKNKATKKLRALTLDKKDVVGRINDGWLGFISAIAGERSRGERIGTDEFAERVAGHEAALAELAASSDPAQAALQATLQAAKDKAKKIEGVNRKLTEAITSGLSEGVVSSDGITNMVGSLAKALKMPMPKMVGYDPTTATVDELKVFVKIMIQFKRWDEIAALSGMLVKVLEGRDRAVSAQNAQNETLKISKVG